MCVWTKLTWFVAGLHDVISVGKELRLKQQYFWTAASLADILRRFKNLDKPIAEFPDCGYHIGYTALPHWLNRSLIDVAIQLNDVSILSNFFDMVEVNRKWSIDTPYSSHSWIDENPHRRRRGTVDESMGDRHQHILFHEPHSPSWGVGKMARASYAALTT